MCQTGPPLCIFLVGVNHKFLHTGFHSRVDPIDHFVQWFRCQLVHKLAVRGGHAPKIWYRRQADLFGGRTLPRPVPPPTHLVLAAWAPEGPHLVWELCSLLSECYLHLDVL
jgi:hypothetical protein